MRMLRLTLLTLILCTSVLMAEQPTDFDYNLHGDDWDCPHNGSRQSPILLSTTDGIQKSKSSHLFGDYGNVTAVANYLNTTIYINSSTSFGSAYAKLIDGNSVPFNAMQIRLRMHSQHKTQQGYFDLEVQIFHVQLYPTSRNLKLVVALLFNVSDTSNAFIQQIINGYQKDKTAATIQVDLRQLVPTNVIDDYWFYLGSHTIPPCSEGRYHWIVSRTTHSISLQQKNKLINILSGGNKDWVGNWRNIQAQNGNAVGFRHLSQIKIQ